MNKYDSSFEFPVIDDGTEFDWDSLFQPQEPSASVVTLNPVGNMSVIPAAETEKAEQIPAQEPLPLFPTEAAKEKPKSETAMVPAAPTAPAKAEAPVSVFDKPPVFSYGGAKENIADASMTFEELRIQKADDFPELEEGKSVTWRVRFGATTKSISDP